MVWKIFFKFKFPAKHQSTEGPGYVSRTDAAAADYYKVRKYSLSHNLVVILIYICNKTLTHTF